MKQNLPEDQRVNKCPIDTEVRLGIEENKNFMYYLIATNFMILILF